MPLPFKALIVDDEKLARQRLRNLLKPYSDLVEIVGEAENGKTAAAWFEKQTIDLVFLDIQMPVWSGFDLLKHLQVSPKVVFVTAYEEYALKAFEQNSIDYLLKPIDEQRLAVTINKLRDQVPYGQLSNELIERLMQESQPQSRLQSLAVSVGDRLVILKLSDLVYFQAEDKYVTVHLQNGKKYLLSKSLTQLEKELPENFLRIHRAYMINRDFALEMQRGFNYRWSIRLNNSEQTNLPCGTSYTAIVKEKLGYS